MKHPKKNTVIILGILLVLIIIFITVLYSFKGSSNSKTVWQIIWSDEFEGSQIDPAKWAFDTGNGFYSESSWVSGWGNEELQFYSENNATSQNGNLVIRAESGVNVTDSHGTYQYTSAKLTTSKLFSQKYGRFEARIKLPTGQGLWPAFWMLPQDEAYGGWAASGEIDIMENAGSSPNKIGGALHYGGIWPANTYTNKEYRFPAGEDAAEYHIYSIEWEPEEIRWYVDDKLYQSIKSWYSNSSGSDNNNPYPAPFDQEFYLILNLAVGGWYDGPPQDDGIFPAVMMVDYVRVYERGN